MFHRRLALIKFSAETCMRERARGEVGEARHRAETRVELSTDGGGIALFVLLSRSQLMQFANKQAFRVDVIRLE